MDVYALPHFGRLFFEYQSMNFVPLFHHRRREVKELAREVLVNKQQFHRTNSSVPTNSLTALSMGWTGISKAPLSRFRASMSKRPKVLSKR